MNADRLHLRWTSTLVTTLCLLAAMNGPAVTFSTQILERPFTFEDWPFNVPIHFVVGIGIWRLRSVIDRTTPWNRSNLWLAGALAAWVIASGTRGQLTTLANERALLTAGVIGFGASFAFRSFQEQVVSIFAAAHVATMSSLMFLIGWPDRARTPIDESGAGGYLQGIFANRNSLGPVCALAVLGTLGVIALWPRRPVILLGALSVTANLWLLVETRSVTPVLGLAAAAAVASIVWAWRRWFERFPAWVLSAIGATLVGTVWLRGPSLDVLGRDSGLSDRTKIWRAVADISNEKPIAGHGFWSFWDSDRAWPLYEEFGGFQFGSAHNSVLEMALGTGWVGAALFVGVIGFAVRQMVCLIAEPGIAGMWWPPLTAFLLVAHTTESFVLFYSYLLILLIAASVLPAGRDHRPADEPIPTTANETARPAENQR